MTSVDSSKVVLGSIGGIYFPINANDLEFIGPQVPMYNLETRIIGNNNWQKLNILQKENIGPHLKGLSIVTNFNKQIIDLEKKLSSEDERPNFINEDLRKRQYLSGLSIEDLELILHPMADEGKEAAGSMGDDTPVSYTHLTLPTKRIV